MMKTQKIQVTNVTNTPGFIHTWLIRAIGIIGMSISGFELYHMLVLTEGLQYVSLVVSGALVLLFATLTVKSFNVYTGVRSMGYSDYGVHSNKDNPAWESITDIYLKNHLGIPLLFVEYQKDGQEQVQVLKTALDRFGGKAVNTLHQVKEKWDQQTPHKKS